MVGGVVGSWRRSVKYTVIRFHDLDAYILKAGLETLEIALSFDKPLVTLMYFIDRFGTFIVFHYSKSERRPQSLGEGFGVLIK